MIFPEVPAAVIKKLLKIYLKNGTWDPDITLNISLKLLKVGLLGINRGGKTHNSSWRLNALEIISAIGRAIITANISKNTISRKVPSLERLTRLLLFNFLILTIA